jgi:cytochrome b involved in lipid metabolism
VTSYLDFHPGGIDELMRGAGKDATALFDEVCVHKFDLKGTPLRSKSLKFEISYIDQLLHLKLKSQGS